MDSILLLTIISTVISGSVVLGTLYTFLQNARLRDENLSNKLNLLEQKHSYDTSHLKGIIGELEERIETLEIISGLRKDRRK